MIDDPVLVNDWHPVAGVDQLARGGPLGARLLGEDIVLWRSGDDHFAWRDLCVHRGTRLSLGDRDLIPPASLRIVAYLASMSPRSGRLFATFDTPAKASRVDEAVANRV